MNRLYDFDALRAVTMLLGIVLHAAGFLLPFELWPVHVEEYAYSMPLEENPYVFVISIVHGFRMPTFFMLSGFFTAMLVQSPERHQLMSPPSEKEHVRSGKNYVLKFNRRCIVSNAPEQ